MPRRPKPKNTLSAGERVALYEAEKRSANTSDTAFAEPSEISNKVDDAYVTDSISTAAEKEKPTKEKKAKKPLPKPQRVTVNVDLSIPVGEIAPLHGICNGPTSYGADISHLFKEIGVPAVRFDGTDTPMSGYAVDISRIFKNPDADPSDEENYDFSVTDRYVTAARLSGAEIVYRLGESRDIFDPERCARIPSDVDALARVCVNIIRHYNDRWAGGFSLGIKYFEIWSRSFSRGGLADDAEIYRRLANAVKLYDEGLMVGGMSFSRHTEAAEFLRYCKKNRAPVDFLTVDCFGGDPNECLSHLSAVRKSAVELGYPSLELIVGKWAFVDVGDEEERDALKLLSGSDEKSAEARSRMLSDRGSLENAAFSAAFLLGLCDNDKVTRAFAFDGQPIISPFCGICDRSGERMKQFYALKAFGELYRAGGRVLCQCESPEGFGHGGIYAVAAVSESGECYVMIASFDGCDTVDLRLDGIPENVYTAEVFMLDGVKNMESAAQTQLSGIRKRLVLNLSSYGVILVRLY